MGFIANLWFIFFPIVLVSVLIFCSLFFLRRARERRILSGGMNLSLFLVTIPQEFAKRDERQQKPQETIYLKESLKTVEQFYNSLAGIKEKKLFKRFIFGNPFFVFEVAVHRIGEEIYFYVACPRNFAGMLEKQILGFWPKAQIQPAPDYNIFNPSGFSAGIRASFGQSAVLPIQTYENFGIDPFSVITSVFTKLAREGEGAAIQILLRPSQKKIKKISQKVVNLLAGGAKLENAIQSAEATTGIGGLFRGIGGIFSLMIASKEERRQFPPDVTPTVPMQQELIAAISKKASQPIFDVNLRILVSAPAEQRAQEILRQFESAFGQFSSPLLNQIDFKELSRRNLKKLFYRFSFRIFSEQEIMPLSSTEISGLFHFPLPFLATPHVKWLKAKQAPPPENLPREGILVGKNVFRGEERDVRVLDDDRRRHFYIVGQTGTGKSVLLQEMIRQDIEQGKGVALIDPHGELAEKVLPLIPASRAEDVIYFNPGDIERPIGLNMLEYDPNYPEAKTFVVNEILEIFEKLYNLKTQGFGGPIFEQYMRNALLLVMEDPESGSTLIEVPKVLADPNFRRYKLSRCRNVVVKNFWELEAEKAGGEAALANMVPYITSKMNVFIANDLVRPIISQQKSAINFREAMDQGKIVIVNLSKGKLGDMNSYLLGMIIVGKILIAAMSRADLPEEKRRDFYLYIDEFHNVTTKTIASILAEARKYRLAMIFGHQFIGQLDEDTRKAIFGNVGSILTFRVGPEDAKYLVAQFEPYFEENDLVNLDNYNAALRLLIRGATSKPFNIVTFPPSPGNVEISRLIRELSRAKYGRNRDEVENELWQRMQRSYL